MKRVTIVRNGPILELGFWTAKRGHLIWPIRPTLKRPHWQHKTDPSAACLHCGHNVALHPDNTILQPGRACTVPGCDCDAFIPQEYLDQ